MKTSLVINDLEQILYDDPSVQRSIKLAKFSKTNQELFITADNFDNIHLWMNENPQIQAKFESIDQMAITCLQLNMNDNQIFSGNKKGLISIWDIETQKIINTFQPHNNLIKVIINYNQNTIISGSADKKITFIDLREKQKIAELLGHHLQINDIQITDNKQILASSSNDGTVKIWDLRQSNTLATFSEHQSPVTMLCLLQKQQMLVSGEEDNMMMCWDLNKLVQYSEDLVQCSVSKLICDQQQSVFFSISSDFITAWNVKLEMLGQFTTNINQVYDATIDKQITVLSQSLINKFSKTRIQFPQYGTLSNEQEQQKTNYSIQSNPLIENNSYIGLFNFRPKTAPGNVAQNQKLQEEDDLFKRQNMTEKNQFNQDQNQIVLEGNEQSPQKEEQEEDEEDDDIINTQNFCLSMPFKKKNSPNTAISNPEIINNEFKDIKEYQDKTTDNPFYQGNNSQNVDQSNQEIQTGDKVLDCEADQFSKCFYPKIKIVEVQKTEEEQEGLDLISTDQFSLRFSQILFNNGNKEYYKQIELIDEIDLSHLKFIAIMNERINQIKPIVNSWVKKNFQQALFYILEQTNLAILLDFFKLISDRPSFNNIKEDYYPQLLQKAQLLLESQYNNYQSASILFIQTLFNAISEKILSTRKQLQKRPNTSPQQKTLNDKIIYEFEKINRLSKNLLTDQDEKVAGQAKQLCTQLSVFLNKI